MKHIEITFNDNILEQIESIITGTHLSYSDIIEDAVKLWLKSREVKKFEDCWIEKLKQFPDDSKGLENWIPIQEWSDNESW